jgi:hypothetical protein
MQVNLKGRLVAPNAPPNVSPNTAAVVTDVTLVSVDDPVVLIEQDIGTVVSPATNGQLTTPVPVKVQFPFIKSRFSDVTTPVADTSALNTFSTLTSLTANCE